MTVSERYRSNLDLCRNEKRAATLTLAQVQRDDPATAQRLTVEIRTATYAIRSYGRGAFYCWLHHPAITGPTDPWPASRMPVAVAMVEIAKALNL